MPIATPPTATLSRPGQANLQGDPKALFLKVYSGEVLAAYTETNIMQNLHRTRVINYGKAATFPVIWKAGARYHRPGDQIIGANQIAHNEMVINIDSLLISDVFVYDLDEAMNHYEIRREYAKQSGAALGRYYDRTTMQVGILAARADGNVVGAPGGTIIGDPDFATDGKKLGLALFTAAQVFDEKDVPKEGRTMIVRPAQFYLMAQVTDLINKDWGGLGAYKDGTLVRIAGINIMQSNNVPDGVVAANEGENNQYAGDFSKTIGLCFHRDAIGTVQLRGLSTQISGSDINIMYQGTLMVSKYALGHGILRPQAAIEFSTEDLTP